MFMRSPATPTHRAQPLLPPLPRIPVHCVICLSALLILLLSACQPALATPAAQALPAPAARTPFATGLTLDAASARTLRTQGVIWQAATAKLPTDHAGAGEALAEGEADGEYDAESFIPSAELFSQPAVSEFEGVGDGPSRRLNFFTIQRAYPLESLPSGGYARAVKQTLDMLPLQAAAGLPLWENIGPAPMLNSRMGQQPVDVSGRVLALAIDPRNSNVVYAGTALGGVWKSTNGGDSWAPLTDKQPSLAVGALTLDPQNPDIIYAGTGEPTLGLDNYYGAGMLKSTDGGQSWTLLGANVFGGAGISKIVIDPTNPNLLYAASARTGIAGANIAPRGVFKSSDGGQSWQALLSCSDCDGVSDLLINPQTPTTLYAGFFGYGVLRSIDGGQNWQLLGNGLPDPQQYFVQRTLLSMSRANPNVIFASLHVIVADQYDGAVVFKTTDGGQSWAQISTGNFNFCGSQCWYSHVIAVHPTNPNTVLLGGMADYIGETPADFRIQRVVVRSDNNGQNWTDLSPNTAPNKTLHPDMHAIAFDPNNAQTIWVGNDGGIFRSTDGGATWTSRNTNLATLQFTGFAVDSRNDQIIQGGMQDNNKAFTTNGGTNRAWTAADVGDGGFALIDPFDSNLWYGTRFGKSFQRNDLGANTVEQWPYKVEGVNQQDGALFYMPIAADPATSGVFYLGTYRLYRTANHGENWTPISPALGGSRGFLSAITVAPSEAKTIYVGTADGNIQVTRNGGGSWTNTTKAPLPGRFVSEIAVHPTSATTAYAVYNGFNTYTPTAPGHIFKTVDGGAKWLDLSANLPDVPLLSIVLDRNQGGTLYLGSDTGVFQSTDDGRSWVPFNNGLPNVAVVDLALNSAGSTLFAATHGRSVFKVVVNGGATGPVRNLYLPLVNRAAAPPTPGPTFTPQPTVPPTATPLPVATNTPTATPTPVTPQGTQFPTLTPTLPPPPTGTPTPTRTPGVGPTPVATATPDVRAFQDDFGNPNSGWPTGTAGTCASNYLDLNNNGATDLFAAQVLTFDDICIYSAPAAAQTTGVYESYAVKDTLNDGSIYGLVFGLNNQTINNNSRFYTFWVDPSDQTYALQLFNQGSWTNLTGNNNNAFRFSNTINSGTGLNHLRVRREGNLILLFINHRFVDVVTNNTLANFGFVGVANWYAYNTGSARSGFDDFAVNRIAEVYRDGFAADTTGWFVDAGDVCQAAYADERYRTATQPDYLCLYRSPAEQQINGRFDAVVRRGDSFYQTAYGLMLGEDGNFSSYYALLVIPDIQAFALAKYVEGAGWFGLSWDPVEETAWLFSDKIRTGTSANRLIVERDEDLFSVWINDQFVDAYTDDVPLAGGFYGVINWSSEFDTAIADFDDFNVVGWDPGSGALARAAATKQLSASSNQLPHFQPLPGARSGVLPK